MLVYKKVPTQQTKSLSPDHSGKPITFKNTTFGASVKLKDVRNSPSRVLKNKLNEPGPGMYTVNIVWPGKKESKPVKNPPKNIFEKVVTHAPVISMYYE